MLFYKQDFGDRSTIIHLSPLGCLYLYWISRAQEEFGDDGWLAAPYPTNSLYNWRFS